MITSTELRRIAVNIFQEGEGGFLISRLMMQRILYDAAETLDNLSDNDVRG